MYTKGIPSPSVQKAMLTPSAVCAYWMRGSMMRLFYTIGKKTSPADAITRPTGRSGCALPECLPSGLVPGLSSRDGS